MEDEFLTIKEAAQILGVTPLTLRNWDRNGKFTASRHPINNYRVYKKAEIDMFIDDMKSKRWSTQNNVSQGHNRDPKAVKKLSVKYLED